MIDQLSKLNQQELARIFADQKVKAEQIVRKHQNDLAKRLAEIDIQHSNPTANVPDWADPLVFLDFEEMTPAQQAEFSTRTRKSIAEGDSRGWF